jgi:hypothetical protein
MKTLIRMHPPTWLSLLTLLSIACSGDDDAPRDSGRDAGSDSGSARSDSGSDSGAAEGSAYLLMHTVDSPEERQNYVFVVPDLNVGDLSKLKGREVSGASRAFVLDKKVYVADAESLSIKRFTVDSKLQLVDDGEMSFLNHGVTYFDTGWTFIDEERAYYMNSEQLEVIVWNPKTMTITGSIDLSSLKVEGFADFYADGGTLIGDNLYSIYWNNDYEAGQLEQAVTVAIISAKEDKLIGTTRDDRCWSGWPGSILPDGHFYVPGNAASSGMQFSSKPKPPSNCLLRIKKGETEFDADFVKQLDDLTAPLIDGLTFDYARELDGAVVWAVKENDIADQEAFNTDSEWHPRLVDVKTWRGTEIDDEGLRSNGWKGDTFVIDGQAHFTVGTNGGSGEVTGGKLVRYQDGKLDELISFGNWLQVAQRIR